MIGETFGSYQLIEFLGAGGMGEVYRALDLHLHRVVAIKLLPRSASSSKQRARFLREARTASALNNPHIVTIHHVGSERERDYIVMEYVEGRTLRAIIDSGSLSLTESLDYAGQISKALSAAHSAGVIHRDLKPNNIMVTPEGVVKVLDFGLAKMTGADVRGLQTGKPTVGAELTETGMVMGTPAYMSPEQAEGKELDSRSDLFSLGTILYEMLSGKLPFVAHSLPALLHEIVYRDPQPLTSATRPVPASCVPILEKALAKEPERRYSTAADFRAALERVATDSPGAPTVLRSARTVIRRRPNRKGRRRRRWIGAGAVALLLAVSFLTVPVLRKEVASWVSSPVFRGERKPFELYTDGIRLVTDYHERDNVQRAVDAFQRAIAQDPEYAPAYSGLAEAYFRQYDRSLDPALLDQAVRYADHAVALDGQLANAHISQGLVRMASSDIAGAHEAIDHALQLDPLNAKAHRIRAMLLQRENRAEEAEIAYERTLELNPRDWEAHVLLGSLQFQKGRYEDAVASFRASTEISPDNTIAYRNLGAAQHMLGRFPEAAAAFQKALQIRPDPFVYANLGTLYFFQGLFPQAAAAFERSVELGPNNYLNWGNLGDSYRQIPGREKDAAEAYLRAIQLAREHLASAPDDVEVRSQLALYMARRGDPEEARSQLARMAGETDLDPLVLHLQTLTFEALGDREQALESLARSLDAGYSAEEIKKDPELVSLREDVRYHRLMVRQATGTP